MAPSHLLGRAVCSEAFVPQLLCTNFSYNSNKFQADKSTKSLVHSPAEPWCCTSITSALPPLSHWQNEDIPHHLPQCSQLFMYWIGSSFTTCIWPQLRIPEPCWAQTVFSLRLCSPVSPRFRDSTANVLESSFQNTQHMFIPSHQWHTSKSPNSGNLAAVPVLLREEMKLYNSLF